MSRDLTIAARAAAGLLCAAACAATQAASLNRARKLGRVTYGPTSATVDQYLELGRKRFLDQHLHPTDVRRPEGS